MDADEEYLPHDLVIRILCLLDFKLLLRFACVCKAWHSTITGDRFFHREHRRLQELQVLIAPRIKSGVDTSLQSPTPGLYRWERKIRQGAFVATLVEAMDSFPAAVQEAKRHTLAHCHGLVLVAMDGGLVRVLNPATRRALTLPPSPHSVAPQATTRFHPALGLGQDPRTGTYKVARFFYGSSAVPPAGITGCMVGLEVFTIGRDEHWRETTALPMYPAIEGRTATFFKGSLLWALDEPANPLELNKKPVRGFLRFSLEDESFSVMSAPPGCPNLKKYTSNLVEMHGELCLAHERHPNLQGRTLRPWRQRPHSGSAWIWASSGVDPPRWVWRHVVDAPLPIHLIAELEDGGMLFQGRSGTLEVCSDGQAARRATDMHELRYHHPVTKKLLEYTKNTVHGFDVIPFVPSLVPI